MFFSEEHLKYVLDKLLELALDDHLPPHKRTNVQNVTKCIRDCLESKSMAV